MRIKNNYKIRRYWNPKTKISPTQNTYFDKKYRFNKTVVSNKVSFAKKGFEYFISYKDSKKIKPLCIFLKKMSAYRKDFDETKYVSFLIKDNKLLEKYKAIWEKVKNSLKKNFKWTSI